MKAVLLVPCAVALLGCARGAPAPNAGLGRVPADSLRGMVAVVGSEPGTWVVLQTESGARATTLAGASGPLRGVTGFEVVVWGAAERPGVFRVDRFAVRAVDGQPALDGTVRRAGSGWTLQPADGPAVPLPSLQDVREGARIWLVRAPDGRVTGHGVISAP